MKRAPADFASSDGDGWNDDSEQMVGSGECDWGSAAAALGPVGDNNNNNNNNNTMSPNNAMSPDQARQWVDSMAAQLEPNPLLPASISSAYGQSISQPAQACHLSTHSTTTAATTSSSCIVQGAQQALSAIPGQQSQEHHHQQASSQYMYPFGASSTSASASMINANAALHVKALVPADNTTPDQNVTAFTEQDEKDELANLTIEEIIDAEHDVRGQLTAAMGNLSVAGGATGTANSEAMAASAQGGRDPSRLSASDPISSSVSASAPRQLSIEDTSALLLLRAELLRIPPHQKRSYTNALQLCPDQVNQEVQLAYLRRDGHDAHRAAGRIVQYWENRLEIFGQNKCYLPMTLDGAAREEVNDMRAESLMFSTTVLPVKDTNGRAVVYVKANQLARADATDMEKMVRPTYEPGAGCRLFVLTSALQSCNTHTHTHTHTHTYMLPTSLLFSLPLITSPHLRCEYSGTSWTLQPHRSMDAKMGSWSL
jgi:hypothetical protein